MNYYYDYGFSMENNNMDKVNSFNNNFNSNFNNNFNNNFKNANPSVGFERGNLFDNLYEPYKNYRPVDLNPKNEKEYMMYQIQMYNFALNDLNLYLDVNPNDSEMLRLRDKFQKEYEDAFKAYEIKYGALTADSAVLDKTPWGWASKFPWEVGY